MARVRFVSWNVQDYGIGVNRWRRGPGVGRLNAFIASVVSTQNVDILGIMEVQPIGVNWLNHLLRMIRQATGNNDWCYDVVKGCVANGVGVGEANITGHADLDWQSGQFAPRREGYAFFWNNSSANFRMLRSRITMSQGTVSIGFVPNVPANAASITLRGRDSVTRTTSPYIRPTGGINPPGALGTWEDSYYPESSNYFANALYWEQCRRPAYVIIRLQNGNADQQDLMPFMIYHAPAAAIPSKAGTFTSGIAQELYAVHQRNFVGAWQPALLAQDNAVAAGDYNVRVDEGNNWDNVYGSYHSQFGVGNDAGAEMDPIYDDTNPLGTVVQTNSGFANTGPPIVSGNIHNYYHAPIDQMFERIPNIITRHSYTRLRIPELILNGQALAGGPVTNFWRSLTYAVNHHNVAMGPIGNGGPMIGLFNQYYPLLNATVANDWTNFRTGVQQGFMPNARSAALFYRTFISDHLPLLIDFTV